MNKNDKIVDNPYAYPGSRLMNGTASEIHWGMTLRDHFAGLAMQSAFRSICEKTNIASADELLEQLALISKNAYWIADRMLEQRQK